MAIDGISRLITVTRLTSRNAREGRPGEPDQREGAIPAIVQRRGHQLAVGAITRTFYEYSPGEQQRATMELQQQLQAFRPTLSPPAAALLDLWLQWAAQHR